MKRNAQLATRTARHRVIKFGPLAAQIGLFLALGLAVLPVSGREKDTAHYGAGLIVNVPLPESEVVQVVQDVAQNGIIRGTKEYNKDEYVTGATVANSARGLAEWTEGGKIFYKARIHALDPRNFKNGSDVGTLSVRYVVQAQGDHNTVLRIDAIFAEDFRHVVHQSNGSVEGAEYKDIHDRLDSIELMKSQTAEAEKERQEQLAKPQDAEVTTQTPRAAAHPQSTATAELSSVVTPAVPSAEAASPSSVVPEPPSSQTSPAQTLDERVRDLRRQVERLIKSPGAAMKSAPFHSASTLKSLASGTEVMIIITTPYWFGVETREGQHGWIMRDQLEQGP